MKSDLRMIHFIVMTMALFYKVKMATAFYQIITCLKIIPGAYNKNESISIYAILMSRLLKGKG
jgi:hypothetical protein